MCFMFDVENSGIAGYLQKYCEFKWTTADLSVMQVVYQIAMAFAAEYDERDPNTVSTAAAQRRRSTLGGMACTAAVVAGADGHVVHGRNLDWINASLYQPLTTELTYVRGGAVVAVTMSFFPELGPTTALSRHASFSYNARTVGEVSPACLLLQRPVLEPFQLVVRQRMLADNASSTYAALVGDYTAAARLCAPAYLVFSGPGAFEGTLLTFPVMGPPRVHALSPEQTFVSDEGNSESSNDDNKERREEEEQGNGDQRPHWYVAVANDDTEYEVAAGWSKRYNKTLALLDEAGQEVAATRAGVLDRVMNVSGVRTASTCYAAAIDVRRFEWTVVVRSPNVTDADFVQDPVVPPEEDENSSFSTSTTDSRAHGLHSASANGGGATEIPAWTWAVVGVGAAIVVAAAVVLGVCVAGWHPHGAGTLQERASGTAHARLEDDFDDGDAEVEDFGATGLAA